MSSVPQNVIKHKVGLLNLAAELGNVSRACKVMGYSRQKFDEIWRNFQTCGSEGLIDRLPRREGAASEPGCSRDRDGDHLPCT
jgi:molybdenum-dependent DNA-binding transcriptional regulator ModE